MCFFFFSFKVKKDIPPSAVTRPIFGILGTIHLVAGKLRWVKKVIKLTLVEYKMKAYFISCFRQ